MEEFAASSANSRYNGFSDGVTIEQTSGDEENFDPNKFSIKLEPATTGSMKAKLKDRRSLMKKQGSSRRRRRSSARFLKIVPNDDDDEFGDKEGVTYDGISTTNLGEVYRNAIRMNAENRINASNSWNLNLIDHLDRFVTTERHGAGAAGGQNYGSVAENTIAQTNNATGMASTMDPVGVNFTKASCTLDASVKIYSYRVDDVHLTSYKVLANLNRTDSNANDNRKKTKSRSDGNSDLSTDSDEEDPSSRTKSRSNTIAVDTLEQNAVNINIHKLDAAFDIDPLFHKMSKTFDEGGAKGLLLANLGVGSSGCNIVFDSTLDKDDTDKAPKEATVPMDSNAVIEVSSLTNKFQSLLSDVSGGNTSIENMRLVPQLSSLRSQYADLGKDGFVDEEGLSSKRYASSPKDEAEADKSIHLEAIERSRASQADLGRSLTSRGSLGSYDSHGSTDYGETGFDYGGDDNDIFGDLHDGDHRFSSSSFAPARASFSSLENHKNDNSKVDDATNPIGRKLSSKHLNSQAIVLLDAIAAGDISTEPRNNYEYFNSQALKNLSSGNLWAGAEHWKKLPNRRRRDEKNANNRIRNRNDDQVVSASKSKGQRGKSSTSALSLVSISRPIKGLEEMLEKPKRRHVKNTTDPLQLTKAMLTKYGNNDNLLPLDAGLGVNQFITLFSRPNESLVEFVKAKKINDNKMSMERSGKVVGFSGVETWETDECSGIGLDFCGGDDGYEEHDDVDEFMVPTLEDVRKVDKIDIGYAKVARKVDVKRLKRDLWTELEQTFARQRDSIQESADLDEHEDCLDHLSADSTVSDQGIASKGSDEEKPKGCENNGQNAPKINEERTLSFQDTVRDMQNNQSQSDVTVPFYFICILHLCNEKGLALESLGLDDFVIQSS